jgi:glycosyltransferase involved in cell wall biosynthesis
MNGSTPAPLVSVVLTTYDRRDFLSKAIETVTDQTYDNIELIIVDDHSPEAPQDIVDNVSDERFEEVKFIRHTENKGVSAARNTGIESASGNLIALLDDDDTWIEHKIERQVEVFQRDSDIGFVYTGMKSVDLDGSTITIQSFEREGNITKDLLCGFIVPLPSIMVRYDVIKAAGLFDEEMMFYEDSEWIIRLSQHCTFGVISDPLLVTLRDDDDVIHIQKSSNIQSKIENGFPKFMEKCRPIAAEYGQIFEQKMTAYSLFRLGYASLSHNEHKLARQYMLKAALRWPFVFRFYLYLLAAILGDTWYKRVRNVKRTITDYRHRSS